MYCMFLSKYFHLGVGVLARSCLFVILQLRHALDSKKYNEVLVLGIVTVRFQWESFKNQVWSVTQRAQSTFG